MRLLALPFSTSGRLASRPFAVAVTIVYFLGFLSQGLLSGQVTGRAGLWPFMFLQAVLLWVWLALHIKRLRDAGQPPGMAIGVCCLYVLSLVLLVLIMVMITAGETSTEAARTGQGLLRLVVALWFIGLMIGHGDLGAFGYWLGGFIVLLLLPLLIAIGFSIRTGLRPSVP